VSSDSILIRKYIIVFESVHSTLSYEKELREAEIPYQIIPTPRGISTDCGLSIIITPDQWESLVSGPLEPHTWTESRNLGSISVYWTGPDERPVPVSDIGD
jgi:hypothetical protein